MPYPSRSGVVFHTPAYFMLIKGYPCGSNARVHRWLFAVHDLHFPLIITAWHIFLKIPASRFCMWLFRVPPVSFAGSRGRRVVLFEVAPSGVATAADIGLSNLSYLFITVTYYTIVKSSVPLWIMMFSACYGLLKLQGRLFFVIGCIIGGITLATLRESADGDGDGHMSNLTNATLWNVSSPSGGVLDACGGGGGSSLAGPVNASVTAAAARRLSHDQHLAGAVKHAGRQLQQHLHRQLREAPAGSDAVIGCLLVLGASLCAGFRWACTQLLLTARAPPAKAAVGSAACEPSDAAPTTTSTTAAADSAAAAATIRSSHGGAIVTTGRATPYWEGMGPLTLLYYSSPFGFLVLLPLGLAVEGSAASEYVRGRLCSAAASGPGASLLMADVGLLMVGGVLAFFLLLAELRVVQLSSGLTLSVAGVFKELLTVGASAIFFGDVLTPYNVGGLLLCLVGIAVYNHLKLQEMARSAAKGDDVSFLQQVDR